MPASGALGALRDSLSGALTHALRQAFPRNRAFVDAFFPQSRVKVVKKAGGATQAASVQASA